MGAGRLRGGSLRPPQNHPPNRRACTMGDSAPTERRGRRFAAPRAAAQSGLRPQHGAHLGTTLRRP
eukprot:12462256-Alexandrium_andersonii.AAC.1